MRPVAPATPGSEGGRRAVVFVAAAALLVFVPALHGGFVYDDHRFLASNPNLSQPSIVWRAFTDPSCQTGDGTHAGLYRPLRTLSFALDRAVFGASPAGPHAVNLLLHAAGCAALTTLLLGWRVPALAAALGGLVYALHPAQGECVAWISSRGDLIAAACVWGALALDLRERRLPSLLLGSAALLAKGEQAVVWPALVVLSRLAAGRPARESFRAAVLPAVLGLSFVLLRTAALEQVLQEGGLGRGPPPAPVMGSMLAHQAWTAVLPTRAVFDWQMPWASSPPAMIALVVTGGLAALFLRTTCLPVAWFLVGITPTWAVQAFVPLNILVADRFLLFALPAVALTAARGAATHRAAAAAVGVVACCFGALTLSGLPAWTSDTALWGRTAERVPGHWRANAWLGIASVREGRFEDAERYLGVAASSQPGDGKTRFFLAQAQEVIAKRDRDEVRIAAALQNYRASIEGLSGPRAEGAASLLPLALWAEADLTLLTGDVDRARESVEALLRSDPPALGDDDRRVLDARIDALSRRAEIGLGAATAERLRRWGARR